MTMTCPNETGLPAICKHTYTALFYGKLVISFMDSAFRVCVYSRNSPPPPPRPFLLTPHPLPCAASDWKPTEIWSTSVSTGTVCSLSNINVYNGYYFFLRFYGVCACVCIYMHSCACKKCVFIFFFLCECLAYLFQILVLFLLSCCLYCLFCYLRVIRDLFLGYFSPNLLLNKI